MVGKDATHELHLSLGSLRGNQTYQGEGESLECSNRAHQISRVMHTIVIILALTSTIPSRPRNAIATGAVTPNLSNRPCAECVSLCHSDGRSDTLTCLPMMTDSRALQDGAVEHCDVNLNGVEMLTGALRRT